MGREYVQVLRRAALRVWVMARALRLNVCRVGCDLEVGQASRPISTRQLRTLPRFHPEPINVVVYNGSLGPYGRET